MRFNPQQNAIVALFGHDGLGRFMGAVLSRDQNPFDLP
jgi:hypothetical protein